MNLKCAKCGCRIKPGQLYIERPTGVVLWRLREAGAPGPVHVACPNAREIAHAKRMGREP